MIIGARGAGSKDPGTHVFVNNTPITDIPLRDAVMRVYKEWLAAVEEYRPTIDGDPAVAIAAMANLTDRMRGVMEIKPPMTICGFRFEERSKDRDLQEAVKALGQGGALGDILYLVIGVPQGVPGRGTILGADGKPISS